MAFTEAERAILLAVPGVGPRVIERLEALGLRGLPDLAAREPDAICAAVSAAVGGTCWRNSPRARGAVAGAIAAARRQAGGGTPPA